MNFRKGTLGASLLGNLLTGKGMIRACEGATAMSWGRSTFRTGQDFNAASSFNKFWSTKVFIKMMRI